MLPRETPLPAPIRLSRQRRVLTDLARIFSTIFNPFLTALALFIILAHASANDAPTFWYLAFGSTLFTSFGPMLYVLWLYATDRIADLDMSVRSEREAVFGAFVVFYLLGTAALWFAHAPRLLIATMGGYAIASLIVQYITRYWKISTHALGISASLASLFYVFKQQPLPFMILVPLVCWARVYLKAHTFGQVVGGAVLGTVCVYLAYHYFHLI
ncbi:MAG: phosphatase PAP2 family protein [Candidatus Eremiobacteraeota bacterium]|nr:phosphatase PAP2 family protein [Candidatus Eremiobacteraeota bacterium]